MITTQRDANEGLVAAYEKSQGQDLREQDKRRVILFAAEIWQAARSGTIEADREQLKMIWRRGLNTLDPQKLPQWALDLSEAIESGKNIKLETT